MFIYPHINPIAIQIGFLKIHWYGIMYLISFILGGILIYYRSQQKHFPLSKESVIDLIGYIAFGIILGGRIGYVFIYNFHTFLLNPLIFFKIWEGGMSFHGGLAGGLIALFLWTRKNKRSFLEIADLIAPVVPIGLAAGRIGNFIQGELWGKVTTVPWAMIYPHVDALPRHPSEIYEFLLEGVLLFTILWIYSQKPRPVGSTSGLFLLGYGCARIIAEFFRQPDPQWGYLAFNWFTMGQLLSIPMIIIGIMLLIFSKRMS